MEAMSFFEKLRRAVRDALPPALGLCLTLRANPLLGLAFLIFRRRFHLGGMVFEVPLEGRSWSSLATCVVRDDAQSPSCAYWNESAAEGRWRDTIGVADPAIFSAAG